MRQESRIILIVGVLQTVVAFHRHGVGRPDIEAHCLQAIDEPVPVVHGLDHDTD